jgi:hypothetical protein
MVEVMTQGKWLEVVGPEKLNDRLGELADGVRGFSRGQADIWRQLPYLALQGDGTSGYSSFNGKLYEHGLLHVNGDSAGLYGTFVDCENGNVLSLSGELDLDKLAGDADIVETWLPDGQTFNAQRWLEKYQKAAVLPHKGPASREISVQEWRYSTARQLGLLSVFSRTKVVETE